MGAVPSLRFLLDLGSRWQIAVVGAILLGTLALLVFGVALGAIGARPPVDGMATGPFRWEPDSIGLG